MNNSHERAARPAALPAPGLELLLWWVVLSVVSAQGGWAIALVLVIVTDGSSMLLSGGVEGAAVACGQVFILRRYIRGFDPKEWIYATVMGGTMGWLMAMLGGVILAYTAFPIPGQALPDANYALMIVVVISAMSGAVAGAIVGFMQCHALREVTLKADNWVAMNAIGFALGGALGAPLALLGGSVPLRMTGIAMGELLAAAVLGVGLIWLLRHLAPQAIELNRQFGQWLEPGN